ncbi:MAG: lysylphosphatidylglycerol synthase transmembrane domain-containing protein [Candidatus Bathyarchaeia archaeon]
MTSAKPQFTWKTIILPLIGITAFIVYLYLFQVDIPEIIATVQRADPMMYFTAALMIFVEVFLYAMAWRSLLSFLSVKLSIMKSYLYVWYGTFMDIIIPAESVSGEISRLYLIIREKGNDVSGKVVASLVAHRLISMGMGVASLLIGIFMLIAEAPLDGFVFNLSIFLITITLLFTVLLILLCIKENWTLKIIDWVIGVVNRISRGKWKPTKIRENAVKLAGMFHSSIKAYGNAPKIVAVAITLSTLSWIAYLALCQLVFQALDIQVSWSIILVTQSIVAAVKAIPLGIPFEVGLPEITMTSLYVALGIPFGISATATILTRILAVWLKFFVGFTVQQWIEIRVMRKKLDSEKP